MKSRDRRAERMSEFVTNMFQYNVTVGITRSEIIFFPLEVCGIDDLAVPCLLSSQLLRYAVLVGVADVLEALQQAKRRLLQQAPKEDL